MKYERSYTVPVFHCELANDSQKETMMGCFAVLQGSGVDFVIVDKSKKKKKQLELFACGTIDTKEVLQICGEIQAMYADGKKFNSINVTVDGASK